MQSAGSAHIAARASRHATLVAPMTSHDTNARRAVRRIACPSLLRRRLNVEPRSPCNLHATNDERMTLTSWLEVCRIESPVSSLVDSPRDSSMALVASRKRFGTPTRDGRVVVAHLVEPVACIGWWHLESRQGGALQRPPSRRSALRTPRAAEPEGRAPARRVGTTGVGLT